MQEFPLSSKYIRTDMYVDNVVCSVPSLAEAQNLYSELVGLFKAGGFDLLKWCTNDCGVLWNQIPQNAWSLQKVEFNDNSDMHASSKVLGLKWNDISDTFSFSINIPEQTNSKHKILSTVARIWDPLGFLAAVT
ncbi:hypothetical protein NQ315_013552 [Exocentrus adspersus]|uniref:Uncharacterized protein n=1 Tax=Exocentrus adspersus TaxID=1586481 RepID=A0AAV8V8Z2_9CUCU|nr:hypothetical protein NQ315_013552 [Exocentrus adspersus]